MTTGRVTTSLHFTRWGLFSSVLFSTLAFAASAAPRATTWFSPCCTLVIIGFFYWLGLGLLRSIGLTLLPPTVIWSIHRDDFVSARARVIAWVWTALWGLAFLAALVVGILLAVGHRALTRAVDAANPPDEASAQLPDLSVLEAPVTSTPPGATIFVNGERTKQVTPGKARLRVGQPNTVWVELAGHFPSQTRGIEPDMHQRVSFDFTLEPAANLEVTTLPPGAQVWADGELVLERTPGLTKPIKAGPVTIRVAAPGFLPLEETITFDTQTISKSWTLEECETVRVETAEPGATVTLDGREYGVTPVDLSMKRDTKHVVVVKRQGWSTWAKTLPRARSQLLKAPLVDLEVKAARARVQRAQRAYDTVEVKLAALQKRAGYSDEAGLAAKVLDAEDAMLKATTELEKAQQALSDLLELRGSKP